MNSYITPRNSLSYESLPPSCFRKITAVPSRLKCPEFLALVCAWVDISYTRIRLSFLSSYAMKFIVVCMHVIFLSISLVISLSLSYPSSY